MMYQGLEATVASNATRSPMIYCQSPLFCLSLLVQRVNGERSQSPIYQSISQPYTLSRRLIIGSHEKEMVDKNPTRLFFKAIVLSYKRKAASAPSEETASLPVWPCKSLPPTGLHTLYTYTQVHPTSICSLPITRSTVQHL